MCISYLTIEFRGEFDRTLDLDGWLFGCDVCQTVCPWNVKFARVGNDAELGLHSGLDLLRIEEVLSLTENEFADRFGETPLSRTGLKGLRRNALRVKLERGQTAKGLSDGQRTPS